MPSSVLFLKGQGTVAATQVGTRPVILLGCLADANGRLTVGQDFLKCEIFSYVRDGILEDYFLIVFLHSKCLLHNVNTEGLLSELQRVTKKLKKIFHTS